MKNTESNFESIKSIAKSLPIAASIILLSIATLAIAFNYEGLIEMQLGIDGGQIKIDGRKNK